jgi:hypothetical protein
MDDSIRGRSCKKTVLIELADVSRLTHPTAMNIADQRNLEKGYLLVS